jgi:hypothetical protein
MHSHEQALTSSKHSSSIIHAHLSSSHDFLDSPHLLWHLQDGFTAGLHEQRRLLTLVLQQLFQIQDADQFAAFAFYSLDISSPAALVLLGRRQDAMICRNPQYPID